MKELKLFQGGHPITANDLSWLQASAKETLEYVVKGLCGIQQNNPSLNQNTPYQLFGRLPQSAVGTFVSYAGAIYYKGEVFKVEPGTLVNPNGALLFKTRYGANNPVTYSNATTQNVHTERYLEIGIKTGLIAGVDYIEVNDVKEVDVIRREEFEASLQEYSSGTVTYADGPDISNIHYKYTKTGRFYSLNITTSGNSVSNTNGGDTVNLAIPYNAANALKAISTSWNQAETETVAGFTQPLLRVARVYVVNNELNLQMFLLSNSVVNFTWIE